MGVVQDAQQVASDAGGKINEVRVPLTQRLGLWDLLKETFKQMNDDHLGAFAGNLAYNALFAIFPFFLFLVSLLGIFHATSLVNNLIDRGATAMPTDAVKMLHQITSTITQNHATGAFTVGAVISLLGALWGVSGGFRAVMDAMNVMYGVKEKRPFWKVYGLSVVLSLLVAALIIAAGILVVAGPTIGGAVANTLGVGAIFRWTWNILQWPVLLGFVLLAFSIVYYFAPDVQQKFKFVSPGSIVALVLWLAFSLLFSLYVNNFGSYNKTYGTLAALAIFLLYVYYSAFILLLGAEMNQIVEAHAPDGKDPGERAAPGDGSSNGEHHSHTLDILKENRPRATAK